MRIAIIMTGNMRSYNITFKNLESYLLKQYECDIYVLTYNKRFNIKNGTNIKEEFITKENILNVYDKYVKNITIIDQDTFVEPYLKIKDKNYMFNSELDRLYTIEKLVMLSYDIFIGECHRNNRTYDIIIKARPDIFFNEPLNINFNLTNKQIIIPSNDSGGGFNDHMAYGKPNVMEKYFTYYRSFGCVDKANCDVSIIEAGIKKYLELSGLDIIRVPIKYIILRDIKNQKVVFMGKNNKQFFIKRYN